MMTIPQIRVQLKYMKEYIKISTRTTIIQSSFTKTSHFHLTKSINITMHILSTPNDAKKCTTQNGRTDGAKVKRQEQARKRYME